MSVKVMGMVFDRYPNGGGEMLLALALADHAKHDGSSIFPSVSTLAKMTRQSERSVQYQLRKMEASGWLELVGKPSGGRMKTREYRINPSWIKGENIAPFQKDDTQEKGANSAPFNQKKGATDDTKGCNSEQERVQSEAEKGATAIAPEPSGTVIDPSLEPSGNASLPAGLNLHAWDQWIKFRKKAGLKKYQTNATANKLARYPPAVQAQAVKHSIENEYQGLFPERFSGGNSERSKKYDPWQQLEPNPGAAEGEVVVLPDDGDLFTQVDRQSDQRNGSGAG